MKRVAIIGAGISGLVCALRLEELRKRGEHDFEVILFDAAPRAGGTIETEAEDGFILEKGPDSFIAEKPWVPDLCKKWGMDSEILDTQAKSRKVFVLKNGEMVPLPEGFYIIAPTQPASFAATSLFSLRGKIRMAAEWFIPGKKTDSDESIAAFIRRRFGQEALERVGQPMIAGIYSGDAERLSLSATMPKFMDLERRYGSVIRGLIQSRKTHKIAREVSGPRYGLFLSFKNGMETLVRRICAELPEGTLHLNTRMKIEERDETGRWLLSDPNGRWHTFDAVCLSVNAAQAALLLKDVDAAFASLLNRLYFESVATLNLAFKKDQITHAIDSFGFVVPAIEKKSLTACTFSSQKYENRAPKDYVLMRAFIGGAYGKEFFSMDDDDLIKNVMQDLKKLLYISGEPYFHRMARHPNTLPQYAVGHKQWVSQVEQNAKKHPGLFLTGSSYRGTGITHCVKDAELQADEIYEGLRLDETVDHNAVAYR